MKTIESLKKKKNTLLSQIVNLKDMRKGSLVEQYFEKKRKDGSVVRLGPYTLYTYKEKGQTISRRLSSHSMIRSYRVEIGEFRKFENLCTELLQTSQEICDLKLQEEGAEDMESLQKKQKPKSSLRSSAKPKR
jgi:hypothetical protein